MKLYLTRAEAAELLGVNVQTISNYVEKGLLVESSTKDPNLKMMRILGSSVERLINEGYDVIKQTKAIDALRSELSQSYADYIQGRDMLHKTHRLLKISNGFHKNIDKIAEILSAYLIDNNLPAKSEIPVVTEILKGNSFQYIAENYDISINRINDVYLRALKRLSRGRKISYNQLEYENKQLNERLEAEMQRISYLEREIAILKDRIQPIEILRIPEQLIGDSSLKMTSVRSYNALKANGIENLYDLALITHKQLCSMRNMGSNSVAELKTLMAQHLMFFDDIDSLKNIKIGLLPSSFVEIPIDELYSRRQLLQDRLTVGKKARTLKD